MNAHVFSQFNRALIGRVWVEKNNIERFATALKHVQTDSIVLIVIAKEVAETVALKMLRGRLRGRKIVRQICVPLVLATN